MTGTRPNHRLEEIKELVSRGEWVVTRTSAAGAQRLGLGQEDIQECIMRLRLADFDTTLPSHKLPGSYQDVYKTRYGGHHIYLKLQVGVDGRAVTISFKRDESA